MPAEATVECSACTARLAVETIALPPVTDDCADWVTVDVMLAFVAGAVGCTTAASMCTGGAVTTAVADMTTRASNTWTSAGAEVCTCARLRAFLDDWLLLKMNLAFVRHL